MHTLVFYLGEKTNMKPDYHDIIYYGKKVYRIQLRREVLHSLFKPSALNRRNHDTFFMLNNINKYYAIYYYQWLFLHLLLLQCSFSNSSIIAHQILVHDQFTPPLKKLFQRI